MKIDKIGIIGYGEIGMSIYDMYVENGYLPHVFDPSLEFMDDISSCDILNICIPYTDNFVSIVNDYIFINNPKITIIHSTVAPGTTKKIIGNVCHSPIRGLHPNLKEAIKIFLKYIGSENNKIAKEYAKHLETLNIKSYICKDSLTSEYAKLFDTTYYGLCIAFHSEVMSLCNSESISFEEVMTIYNSSYNEGYKQLDKENVVRPILYPTDHIGGHCIIPNAELLQKTFNSDILKTILKYK